jgi:hypothetical protein
MQEQTFKNVWYSSEQKIRSATKLIVYEDKGTLEIGDTDIRFSSNKKEIIFDSSRIRDVSMARQSIPWKVYLIIDLIALPLLVCGLGIVPAMLLLLFYNAAGFLVGYSTRWVLVEYLDAEDNQQKAYFAQGSLLGWGGFLGGTKRLHQAILSACRKGSEPPLA